MTAVKHCPNSNLILALYCGGNIFCSINGSNKELIVTFDIFEMVFVKDMTMFVMDERILICQTTPAPTIITHF